MCRCLIFWQPCHGRLGIILEGSLRKVAEGFRLESLTERRKGARTSENFEISSSLCISRRMGLYRRRVCKFFGIVGSLLLECERGVFAGGKEGKGEVNEHYSNCRRARVSENPPSMHHSHPSASAIAAP